MSKFCAMIQEKLKLLKIKIMEKYEFTVSKVTKKDNGYNVEGPNGYGCTLGDEHLKGKKLKSETT